MSAPPRSSRRSSSRRASLLRFDADQVEIVASGTHEAIDHHVVQPGDQDLPVAAGAGQLARAIRRDARLTGLHCRAGAQHDAVIRPEFTMDRQGAGGRNGHIRSRPASEHVTLDHPIVPGMERDRRVKGFERTRHVQIQVRAAVGRNAAVEVDAAVGEHQARDVEPAIRSHGRADVHQ